MRVVSLCGVVARCRYANLGKPVLFWACGFAARADKAQYPQYGTENVLLEIFRPAPTGGGTAPTARLRAQHFAVTGRQGRCELLRRPACAGGRPVGTAWKNLKLRAVLFAAARRHGNAARTSASPLCLGRAASLRAPTKCCTAVRERKCGVVNFSSRSQWERASIRQNAFCAGRFAAAPRRRSGSCPAARPKGGGRPPGTAWKDSEPRIPAFIIFAAALRSPRQTRLASVIRGSALSPMGAFA